MADPQSPDDSTQFNSSVNIGDSAQAHVGGDVVGGNTYARDRFSISGSQVTINQPPASPAPHFTDSSKQHYDNLSVENRPLSVDK